MKARNHGKQVTRRLLTSLLGVAACFAVTAQPAFPQEGPRVPSGQTQTGSGTSVAQPPAEKPAAVPEGASGMRIYIDPQTGSVPEGAGSRHRAAAADPAAAKRPQHVP